MSGILIPLTQEQIQYRYKEIGTNEEDVQKSLKILTEWFIQQPHLPKRYAGTFLRSFLLGCKNRIEIAKQKIDNYFYYRNLYPEYLIPRPFNDPSQKVYLLARIWMVLPKCTTEGRRVVLLQHHNDLTLDSAYDIIVPMMVLETLYLQDETASGGMIIICDCQHFNSLKALMKQMSLMKYFSIMSSVNPMSIKKAIYINAGKFVEQGIGATKRVLSEKLGKRIEVISEDNISRLYDLVPKEILPMEYGGSEESCDALREKYYQKLHDMNDWFADRDNLISDESKRPADLKRNHDNVFGVEGSFKTINVD